MPMKPCRRCDELTYDPMRICEKCKKENKEKEDLEDKLAEEEGD